MHSRSKGNRISDSEAVLALVLISRNNSGLRISGHILAVRVLVVALIKYRILAHSQSYSRMAGYSTL